MAIKKSDLYSSLWASCDELRGGMDASQYKDYVLFMLFIKYISDKYGNADDFAPPVNIPQGASFKDMIALKGKPDIGDKINKAEVNARLKELHPGNAKPQLGAKRTKAAELVLGAPSEDAEDAELKKGIREAESTHRRVETSGFEAVGVAVSLLDAFIRTCDGVHGALDEHGGVHEQFGDPWEAFAEAVLKKKIDEIITGGSSCLVFVHGCCFLVRTSSNQFWADTTTPDGEGAPPVRQTRAS